MVRRKPATLLGTVAAVAIAASASAAVGAGRWYDVGSGVDFHVYALHRTGPDLYVGGGFTNAGGLATADRIARWNGTAWSAVGTGFQNGAVWAIATYGSNIFAGGTFLNAGGDADADFLARFDGTEWDPFCTQSLGGNVHALQLIGTTLYVGGVFANANGIAEADGVIACDVETGVMSTTVDGGDDLGAVYALTAANGLLYAGGTFTDVEDIDNADYVAAYDGDAWAALGAGSTGFVRGLGTDGTNVYIGTDGDNVGGNARADHVAKWNGSAWSPLGADTAGTNGWFSTNTEIYDIATTSGLVIATGTFSDANGNPRADNIAYFDGTTWRPMGSNGAGNGPWAGQGRVLAVYRDHIVAGGIFTQAGGAPATTFIARFALRLPDARIATIQGGPFTGNDVYNATGAGQSKNVSIARGSSKNVYINIQNDGIIPATFRVKGTGAATGHTTRYFSGGTNVTSAVKAGTYTTASIAPGGTVTLRLSITLSSTAAASGTFRTQAISVAGTPIDAVRAMVSATN